MSNPLDTALLIAAASDEKKAYDIVVLDIRELTYITDYFVICSGSNPAQVNAITDGITETLAKSGIHPSHIEGQAEARWVLMDYGDVVVHVFDERARVYYNLEKLWGDAPKIPVNTRHHAPAGISR